MSLSYNAVRDIDTPEHAEFFKKLNLVDFDVEKKEYKHGEIPGRNIKFPSELPLQTTMENIPGAKELIEETNGDWDKWKNWTNLDLMGEGYSPIFPATDTSNACRGEVHHDNQTQESNYTILRKEDHQNSSLHNNKKSEIDHEHFRYYEKQVMLEQLVKTLEKKYKSWDKIPNKINKDNI
jgi:hypothetical protein